MLSPAEPLDQLWRGQLASLIGSEREDQEALVGGIKDLREMQRTLPERIIQAEAGALGSAVSEFRYKNLGPRRGSPEEAEHFLRLRDWFASVAQSYEETFANCLRRSRELENVGDRWKVVSDREIGRLQLAAEGPVNLEVLSARPVARGGQDPFYLVDRAQAACSISPPGQPPRAPQPGDALGPIKYVAAWLVNVGSLDLTTMTGMIGFGLLGAVISTFVRERLATAKGGITPGTTGVVWVSDLAGVVLRGLSAAVVVFLAVQGGLAVFGGDQSNPNPYVLLLLCLVAAVFSEDVWARAYDYLAEKLHEKLQGPKPGPQAPGGAAPHPKTQATPAAGRTQPTVASAAPDKKS
jgi:hypothetical protein